MTTPNLFALMGRLEELLQNEKRYLALRNTRGVSFSQTKDSGITLTRFATGGKLDEFTDELIEEQGDIQDE